MSERPDPHDGWTPEPQEQVQPGDPWRDIESRPDLDALRETRLREALTTALSAELHEHADPDCMGDPPYTVTQEQAVKIARRVVWTPVVANALAVDMALAATPEPTLDAELVPAALRATFPTRYAKSNSFTLDLDDARCFIAEYARLHERTEP